MRFGFLVSELCQENADVPAVTVRFFATRQESDTFGPLDVPADRQVIFKRSTMRNSRYNVHMTHKLRKRHAGGLSGITSVFLQVLGRSDAKIASEFQDRRARRAHARACGVCLWSPQASCCQGQTLPIFLCREVAVTSTKGCQSCCSCLDIPCWTIKGLLASSTVHDAWNCMVR